MPSLRNVASHVLSVGGITFSPGSSTNVTETWLQHLGKGDQQTLTRMIAEGAVESSVNLSPAVEEPAAEPLTERETVIQGVIRGLDVDVNDNWTSDGRPQVDAINAMLPKAWKSVTASERDQVFGAMQGS